MLPEQLECGGCFASGQESLPVLGREHVAQRLDIRQLVQTAKARFTTVDRWQPGDPLGLDGLEHEQISREALPGVCDIISARLLERKASEKPLAPSPDDAAV